MEINSKSENYEKYSKGLYGNKLRDWTVEEYRTQQPSGILSFSFRYASSRGGGSEFTAYNVVDVEAKIEEFVGKGADITCIRINESAPDSKLTIQGEVRIDEGGYYFFYSEEKGKMRDCLVRGRSAYGLTAKILLQKHLTPSSLSDLTELFEIYPNSIIEISTYSYNLGSCRGRNTLIWEVRNY